MNGYSVISLVNRHSNILMVLSGSNDGRGERIACKIIESFSAEYRIFGLNARSDSANTGSQMLKAGAEKVIDINLSRESISVSLESIYEAIPPDALVVCQCSDEELLSGILPGVLLFCDGAGKEIPFFPGYEDIAVVRIADIDSFDYQRLTVLGGNWRVTIDATAIVLAGGRSTRMEGTDKALLPVEGLTLLEYVVMRLREWFAEIVISAGDENRYSVAGVVVVGDPVAGLGPVMGLAAGMKVSSCDFCFVTAVDMPAIRPGIVSRLVDLATGADGAMLYRGEKPEPLCAVYRRSSLPAIDAWIESGGRSVKGMADILEVKRLITDDSYVLPNINTPGDFRRFLSEE